MTHLPHSVQVSESPQGWLRSVMIVGLGAAAGDVLGARAFDVPADADAARAKDAAVVVHAEQPVRAVHAPFREAVIVAHVVHALAVGEGLEFAMAVGHADRADVVALGEQQFQRHAAVFAQPFAVGLDVHAFGDFGRAGRQQFGDAGDFHQAQPAGADVIDAFEMAERRDFDAGLGGGLQDRRAFLGADLFAVNGKCFCGHRIIGSRRCSRFGLRRRRLPLPGRIVSGWSSSSYSLRKNRRVLITGFGAVWPRPHRLVLRTMSQSSSSFARSRAVALRSRILSSRCSICTVPARQGMHLPQDSSMQNSMKNRAISTMFVRVVHHDHAAGTHDGTELGERFVIHRRVQIFARECSRRRGRRSGRP